MNQFPGSRFSRFTALLIVALFLLAPLSPANAVHPSGPFPSTLSQASSLLERMTPEERIGQLFLVSFQGTDVGSESVIEQLVARYHVGGVVLLAENDNLVYSGNSSTDTVDQLYAMVRQIQQTEWSASRARQTDPNTGEEFLPQFIPLFIATSQEGNGLPYDQILNGLTPMPNAMSMGATWIPSLSEQVGTVLGKELAILGINLLLGPSLDVLKTPQIKTSNNLGARTFGGDPFWVGEMGRAYIRGVHFGSGGRLAVVAKHFPGHGSSDRLPEEEVATVPKSLDQLESIDLAPFYTVTGNAATPEETTDALLVSHIRYQGLQGNIRATTRPVSLDPQALSLLMELEPLDTWRQGGGVMVSDDLGNQAIRRFYDLTSQTFDPRRVAVSAFLAGNDLLYFSDFSSSTDSDPFTSATRTLEFFTQKYREDPSFAGRVDQSVLRILDLKLRLYTNFNLGNVLSNPGSLDELNKSSSVTFDVARDSSTLISPSQQELDDLIPDPPNLNDRIVFISDVRSSQQCSTCPPIDVLGKSTLQDAVIRLYGPQAGGQVSSSMMSSYSLDELQLMLDGRLTELPLENDLLRSNWIIFGMLSERADIPSFQTLERFLNERPELFLQKRLIVFAFCEPYFLDATNISKLTAYYGMYDVSPSFIDVASYLLFRELSPAGALPVSVPGVDYNLNEALFPDPDQIIPLQLDIPEAAPPETTGTPQAEPTPQFVVGDKIPIRTGIIFDHNGHPVPDGTPVTFVMTTGVEANIVRQEATTLEGVAHTQFLVANGGTIEIYAESERARSTSITFDIPLPPGEIIPDTPTATPTATPEPTFTPLPPTATPVPVVEPPSSELGLGEWILAVLLSGILAFAAYRFAALLGQVRWGIRAGFLAFIGGLAGYSYLALKMPGSQFFLDWSLVLSATIYAFIGSVLGILATIGWRYFHDSARQTSNGKVLPTPESTHQGEDQAQEQETPGNPE